MICSSPWRRAVLVLLATLIAASALWSQAPVEEKLRAYVLVRVHPEAKLTVDGQPTRQKGEQRRFVSPPLEEGKKYTYTFVAEWMPRNNYETYKVTRKVSVEAGQSVEIDMREADLKKGDILFVRYVPTPPQIIDAMMKLAQVGDKDVVYDLGCGDGALVITAVKKFHAQRGVGIDLDPKRIQEAKQKAKEAGVADKVEFRLGNVLEVQDLANATVVMLYLSDELNEQLRPILQKQLKPGARIVSHRFLMDEWKPDKTEIVDLPDEEIPEEKLIHLWTIKKKEGEAKEGKNHSGK
jgi:uncharacterized protein (TIGR03000 family)